MNYTPSQAVQAAARRALQWIQDGKAGPGFTAVGRRRAADLAAGKPVSSDIVRRMASYLARHEVDKQATGFNPGEPGYPSPGRVAWDAWGGDAGKTFAEAIIRHEEQNGSV
jgi:hypothetical protein